MAVLVRSLVSLAAAVAVTGGLFLGMKAMVMGKDASLDGKERGRIADFVRLQKDSSTEVRKRELPKKQKPEPPPQAPRTDMPKGGATGSNVMAVSAPDVSAGVDLKGSFQLGPAPSDGDPVPVVRVNPMYPQMAQEQGISGYVVVGFDVLANGSTANVRVVQSDPRVIFDKAAVAAVSRWKYNPRIVDGKPQAMRGLTTRFSFGLEGQ